MLAVTTLWWMEISLEGYIKARSALTTAPYKEKEKKTSESKMKVKTI